MKEEKIKLLNLQLMGGSILIATIVVSLLYTYDVKLKYLDEERILGDEVAQDLIVINRITIVLVSLLYLYINYRDYELVVKYNQTEQIRGAKLQLGAATLNLISVIIVLYVVLNDYNYPLSLTSALNPEA